MEYTEEILEDDNIIVAHVSGEVLSDAFAERASATRLKARDRKLKILFDFREIDNCLPIIVVHNWFTERYDSIDPALKLIPTAHVANPRDDDHFQFIEASWSSQGSPIKKFFDIDEAIAWLKLW